MKDAELAATIGKRRYLLTKGKIGNKWQLFGLCIICHKQYPIDKEGNFKVAQIKTSCPNCNFEINGKV